MIYKLIDLVEARDGKHKYKVVLLNKETNRKKTVKFGAIGYEDYTVHKDDSRKQKYIKRHSGMGEDYSANGIDTAGFWAMHLLWNKPTLEASLNDIMKKFDL